MATEIGSNNNICGSSTSSSSSNTSGNNKATTAVSAAQLPALKTLNTVTLKPLSECSSLTTLTSLQAFKQDITHRQPPSPPQLCANNQHNKPSTVAAHFASHFKDHETISSEDCCENDNEKETYNFVNASQSDISICNVSDIVTFKPLFKSQPKWIGLSRSITVGSVPTAGMKSLTLEQSININASHQSIGLTMDGSFPPSNTSTLIRARPRVPTGLKFTTASRRHSEDNSVEDIAGALSSLKSTDWRKYSRKGRSSMSSSASTASSTLSPECHTPQSESSTPKAGRVPSFRTVRTHLEKLAKDGITKEKLANDGITNVDRDNINKKELHSNQNVILDQDYVNSDRENNYDTSSTIGKNVNDEMYKINHINGLGFTILPSSSYTDDGGGDSDNKYSSQLSDDLTTPDISDAEYILGSQADHNDGVDNGMLFPGDINSSIKVGNSKTFLVNPQKYINPNVILKNPSGSSLEDYPVALNPFECDEDDDDDDDDDDDNTDEIVNSESDLCSSVQNTPPLLKNKKSPIPLVKVQYPPETKQVHALFHGSVHTGCDSPEGDSVSLSSSIKLKALSSFDSMRDSEEDLSLHVTEEDSQKHITNDSSVETEDEGLGAVDIEDPSYNKVYKSVCNNSSKKVSEPKAIKQVLSNIASSIKNMPSPLALDCPDSKKDEARLANGRFRTHPPIKDRVTNESWSVDSNGLGSLREAREPCPEPIQSQVSSSSSFDSHLGPSESSTDHISSAAHDTDKFSYVSQTSQSIVSQTKTALPSTVIKSQDVNEINSQSDKVKSQILNSNSIKSSLSPDFNNEHVTKVRSRSRSPRPEAKVSASGDSSSDEEQQVTIAVKRPSKKRQRGGSSDRWETKERIAEKIPKTVVATLASSLSSFSSSISGPKVVKSVKISSLPASLPSTPLTSPESTLSRTKSALSPEATAKKLPSLSRSISSASVLQKNKTRPKLGESLRSSGILSPDFKTGSLRGSGSSVLFGSSDLIGGGGSSRTGDRLQGTFSPTLEPIYPSSLSLFEGPDKDKKKRDLIVQEFYSSEKQYVEALQVLVERYLIPLKVQRFLGSTVVDEIFYKINEIYMHHATFLAFLERAIADWNSEATIGDVIYKTFCKQSVVESYVSFIENFPRAEKVLDEVSSKSAFQRFVEQVEREGRIKLPLKAQIVKPAQRIPRYELLLKRLQEHTPVDHADTRFLREAEKALHELALRINSVKQSKKEEDLQETLKKLELLLLTDLAVPERQYIRHDMVQVLNRKDQCCIWLFTDLVVITTIKRKSGPVSRKASVLLQSSSGHDFVENIKQRLWLKLSLEDVEIVQGNPSNKEKKPVTDKLQLETDYQLLGDISELSHKLNCNHIQLDEALRDLVGTINNQLSEHQLKSPPPEANKVDLVTTVNNGVVLNLTVVFPSPDKKISWVALVAQTKQKLTKVRDAKPPTFMQALQITKTRAGMQFSCAAPTDGVNSRGFRDVWVCNSDGYVGHMCLLTLMPEPIVTLNTPVPGCNSRILCICAVPAFQGYSSRNGNARRRPGITEAPAIKIQELQQEESVDYSGEDGYVSDASTSSSDTDDVEMTDDSSPLNIVNRTDSDRSDRTRSSRSDSPSYSLPSSSSGVILPQENPFQNPYKSTMWLGTEDGCIHAFLSTDNIKTTKNRLKLQQSAAVLCCVEMENRVFLSLANGDLVIYKRDLDGVWNTTDFETISLTSASSPINKMLPVSGKLWCASNNDIIVVNPESLEPEMTFTGNPDSKRGIHTMVCSGQGVWVAGNGSSKVLLFHASHYELILDVSIAQAVAQKLQNTDDIIRQHKTACLRITTLLACKDVLWVGTSAGVILTIPMPKLSTMTSKSSIGIPNVTGLSYGHTGHVRFLTCVETPSGQKLTNISNHPSTSINLKQKAQLNLHHQHSRKNSINIRTYSSNFLVISGGDGYEDFDKDANSEVTGKDDSTNHLLLWQV